MEDIMMSNLSRNVDDDGDDDDISSSVQWLLNIATTYYNTIIVPIAIHQRNWLIGNKEKATIHRGPSLFMQRLNWDVFCNMHALHRDFSRHIRMSAESFRKLVEVLRGDLEVNQDQADLRFVYAT
jgi:hypothetical protein